MKKEYVIYIVLPSGLFQPYSLEGYKSESEAEEELEKIIKNDSISFRFHILPTYKKL